MIFMKLCTLVDVHGVPMDTHQKLVGVHGQPPKFRGYPWPPISLARTSLVGNHEILSKLSMEGCPADTRLKKYATVNKTKQANSIRTV